MASVSHGEAVNLGLDVGDRLGVGLQPGDVDLDIEMADANGIGSVIKRGTIDVESTYLQTIASSGITSKWAPVMMSRLPVVVTKTFDLAAASSMVQTS